jgi:hypothetical protein
MSELKLNANDWNALPKEDQAQIVKLLQKTGLLKPGDILKPDPTAAASRGAALSPEAVGGMFCKPLCDIGEAAAVALCAALPPPANAVCIAAAHAGGELCRKNC